MGTNNFTFQNICVVVDGDNVHDFDQFIDNVADYLLDKVVGFERKTERAWTKQEALIIGEVDFHKGNGEHYATISITYKSGYYADGCLDYVTEYTEYSKPVKRIEKEVIQRENRIKQVLRKFGTEIKKVGQFSNGEALYEKA